MIRRPPRSTQSRSSAASDVYKRQGVGRNRRCRTSSLLLPPHEEARGPDGQDDYEDAEGEDVLVTGGDVGDGQGIQDPQDVSPDDRPLHAPQAADDHDDEGLEAVSYTHLTLPTIY